MTILDAVNTNYLPNEVKAVDIIAAAAIVEEEDGPAATVKDIPSQDPKQAAIAEAKEEDSDSDADSEDEKGQRKIQTQ